MTQDLQDFCHSNGSPFYLFWMHLPHPSVPVKKNLAMLQLSVLFQVVGRAGSSLHKRRKGNGVSYGGRTPDMALILRWVESISILPIILNSLLKIIRIYFHLYFIHYNLRFFPQQSLFNCRDGLIAGCQGSRWIIPGPRRVVTSSGGPRLCFDLQ